MELSVVVQGPILPFTQQATESIRKWFPLSQIILSTWTGSNTDDLDYDTLVQSEDSGAGDLNNNIARQIVNTKAGLKEAKHDRVLKVRSDAIFFGNGCLEHIDRWPKRGEALRRFGERIIIPNIGTADPDIHICFNVSDWAMLGTKADLVDLFDIPIENAGLTQKSPEQYIWLSAIQKKFPIDLDYIRRTTPELIQGTVDFLKNNTVILDTRDQFNFYCGKYETLQDDQEVSMRHAKWADWYRSIE